MRLTVAAYDMTSPFECLKCNNPLDEATGIEEVAATLRRLPVEERRRQALAKHLDVEALETYLQRPACGTLGEAEAAKFGAPPTDWSVGFVSVAAGTLLAATLLKHKIVGTGVLPDDRGNTLRYYFLHPKCRRTTHRRRETCDCSTAGARHFERLWQQS
jgi:hypothetical protein